MTMASTLFHVPVKRFKLEKVAAAFLHAAEKISYTFVKNKSPLRPWQNIHLQISTLLTTCYLRQPKNKQWDQFLTEKRIIHSFSILRADRPNRLDAQFINSN